MKNILFPTDFSKTADNAFVYALHLAKTLGADLHVLHTYSIPIVTGLGIESTEVIQQVFDNVELTSFEDFKNEAAELRKIAADEGLSDVKLSFDFQEGDLIINIMEAISKENIDLVVMGTTGASGFGKKFFGSNTVNTIKSIDIPILSVPDQARFSGITRIGFTTLFRDADKQPLIEILKIAEHFDAQVRCLHVIQDVKYEPVEETAKEWDREFHSERLKFILIEGSGDSLEEHISSFIHDFNISFLAVVKRNQNFFERIFSTSLSKKLAYTIDRPLLIIKEEKIKY
ncbi:MAG: universal stress protein [Flavobacteriaceae bacterium]